ncbi:hypothetical protein DPEC_G00209210 [Dallia pectoralis]|uniref:Uncharacterized protein n=1 Tax=Dallia pectoralis TaxID=75939 RepID=A0ACC2G5C4_DALPE|nr:hypothetical protein DPEC_G00209210 [Dallia pectoralis]
MVAISHVLIVRSRKTCNEARNKVHHPCPFPPEDDDASVVSDRSLTPTEDLLESSPSSSSEKMFIDQDRLLCSPIWPLS